MCVSSGELKLTSLEIYLEVELVGYKIDMCLAVGRYYKQFFKMICYL